MASAFRFSFTFKCNVYVTQTWNQFNPISHFDCCHWETERKKRNHLHVPDYIHDIFFRLAFLVFFFLFNICSAEWREKTKIHWPNEVFYFNGWLEAFENSKDSQLVYFCVRMLLSSLSLSSSAFLIHSWLRIFLLLVIQFRPSSLYLCFCVYVFFLSAWSFKGFQNICTYSYPVSIM